MNKRIKRKWIKALRSGEYVQGYARLCIPGKDFDSFCCLGVLTDLAVREGVCAWGAKKADGGLSDPVIRWADFDVVHEDTLTQLNDGALPKTFKQIAAWIEKQL